MQNNRNRQQVHGGIIDVTPIPQGRASQVQGGKSFFKTPGVRLISIILFMLFTAMLGAVGNDWVNARWVNHQKELVLIEEQKAESELRLARIRAQMPTTQRVVESQAVSRSVTGTTFPCATSEQVLAGFAKASVQVLTKGTEYQFGPGCALIRVEGRVKDLVASSYLVRHEVKAGEYFGCGDTEGLKFSSKECVDHLNDQLGKTLQLFVKDGGRFILNQEK
jgi:hypothetical protein